MHYETSTVQNEVYLVLTQLKVVDHRCTYSLRKACILHISLFRVFASFRLSFKRKPESRPAVVSSPSSAGSGGGGAGRDGHRDSLSHAVPAKFIRATTVKPNTLDPRWEEKFRL